MIKSKQIFKKLGVFDGSFLINVVEGAKAFLISLRWPFEKKLGYLVFEAKVIYLSLCYIS